MPESGLDDMMDEYIDGRRDSYAHAGHDDVRMERSAGDRRWQEEESSRDGFRSADSGPVRRVPIDVEDVIRMKQEKEAEKSKLTFLTKAQRRELALKERQAEVSAQREELKEGLTGVRSDLTRQSSNVNTQHSNVNNRGSNDNYRGSNDNYRGSNDDYRSSSYRPSPSDLEREREIELIRREKLGLIEEKKRKITKPSERGHIPKVTYWEDSEDTTLQDYSSLYTKRADVQPQYGRGRLAGMGGPDDDEQNFAGDYDRYSRRDHHKASSSSYSSSYSSSNHGGSSSYNQGRSSSSSSSTSQPHSLHHWSMKPLSEMTSRDWRICREDFAITVKGANIPNPIRSWAESGLPDWALKAVKDANYEKPTAIQMQAIPIGLEGRDLIGLAETGSGKTASFLLPLLVHISKLPSHRNKKTQGSYGSSSDGGPYACILAPTRELALQIKLEADKFAKYADCRTVLLIGGEDLQGQVSELRKGCEIIVATPGRLVDLLNNAWIVLHQCRYVVLDEGDRMIDMGFEDQLLQVLEAMPKDESSSMDVSDATTNVQAPQSSSNAVSKDYRSNSRTTVLFSATMPPPIERLAQKYLRTPATIYVGDVGRTVDRIKQNVEWMKSEAEKKRRLQDLLLHGPKPPIIIFMNHKKACDAMGKFVEKLGFDVVVLHAGKSQEAREYAISLFKERKADVLVATNVAGRGLDVKGVTHVINFDLPDNIEEYTHRIGRTGRAGMDGIATSFLTQNDEKIMPSLRSLLQKTNSKIPRELSDFVAQSSTRAVY